MNYQFDPFIFYYDPITDPITDFKSECIAAATKISKELNKNKLPIMVLMSGGLDSELIGESFYAAGIPFIALIGRLTVELAKNNTIILNEHDYVYAEKWCNDHAITVEYCDVDIYKKAELLTEYALSSKGFSPQYAFHMYLMKHASNTGFFFVAGLGDIEIVLKNNHYFCADTQREWSIDNFCTARQLNGVIRFVKIDSRLTSAFLKMNVVQRLMSESVSNLLTYKHACFSEAFPTMIDRPKYTGFEWIQEWDGILRNYMKTINGKYDTIQYLPIALIKT